MNYTLRVETQPLNPPKPIGIGVFDESKVMVAYLTRDQLEEALFAWEVLLMQREKADKGAATPTSS